VNDFNSILALIPVCNAAATLAQVIQTIQNAGLQRIRVIDTGSTDQTVAIAQACGVEVVCASQSDPRNPDRQELQNISDDIEWVFVCDGGGRDDLSQLPEFLHLRGYYDLVFGDRTGAGQSSRTWQQRWGNALVTHLIHLGWGYAYHDLGGMRLIRRTALEQMSPLPWAGHWSLEMRVRAIEQRLRICEIPLGSQSYSPNTTATTHALTHPWPLVDSLKHGVGVLIILTRLYGQHLYRWYRGDRHTSDPFKVPFSLGLGVFLLALGAALIVPYGDFRDPSHLLPFWRGITCMSLGFMLVRQVRSLSPGWFWGVTIFLRLLLLPMAPGDDIWRYLWEGYVQTLGFNPYELPPASPDLVFYQTEWWDNISQPHELAIYPPLTQLGFHLLAMVSPATSLFKLSFILADILICWLLSRRYGYPATLLYAWNPLVLYVFAGGGHYDSWFILPLVAAWLLFDPADHTSPTRHIPSALNVLLDSKYGYHIRWFGSALLVGISVAVEWAAFPIVVFLSWQAWRHRGLKLALPVGLLGILPGLISSVSFCGTATCHLTPILTVQGMEQSGAAFLPSLWHRLGASAPPLTGLYWLLLGLAVIWLLQRFQRFQEFAEGYLIIVLMVSPVIHAWNFTWLLPFAVASRNLGTQLVSFSAFVYFLLPHRQALGNSDWGFQPVEWMILWMPFLGGLGWSLWRSQLRSPQLQPPVNSSPHRPLQASQHRADR
jgi:hypothetical protein